MRSPTSAATLPGPRPRPCPSPRRQLAASLLAALPWLPWASQAAHPLFTDDTGTQGAAHVEFENGLSRSRQAGTRSTEYAPQLSLGVRPDLDLIAQTTWRQTHDEAGASLQGAGDSRLGLKWRFHEGETLSFGLRAGVTLPTGRTGLGLRHGTTSTFALLIASVHAAPFALHGNLGLTRAPQEDGLRRNLGRGAVALTWVPAEGWLLAVEASADRHAELDRGGWLRSGGLGLIHTLRPGLDVDLGWQTGLGQSQPARTLLLGLTWRFPL